MDNPDITIPEGFGETLDKRLGFDGPTIIFVSDVHRSALAQRFIGGMYTFLAYAYNLTVIGEESKFSGVEEKIEAKDPIMSLDDVLNVIDNQEPYTYDGKWIHAGAFIYFAADKLGRKVEFFGYEDKDKFDDLSKTASQRLAECIRFLLHQAVFEHAQKFS